MKKNKVIDVVEDILQTRSEDKNKRTTAERIVNTLVVMITIQLKMHYQ